MLPPISDQVLKDNPLFSELYAQLTTNILDSDASTRSPSRQDDALDQELRTHRAELAKSRLLQRELELLTSRNQSLPEDLQEALDLLISPYYRSLSDDDKALLQEDFYALEDGLQMIGRYISNSLHKSTLEIARIAYPNESPRVHAQKIDTIAAETALRFNALQKSRATLGQKQLAYTSLCCEILSEYRAMTTRLLALLEQKSTIIPKALTTKAEHYSLIIESFSMKLDVLRHQALESIYDQEAVDALQNYEEHLRDTATRFKARQRVAEEDLRKYRNAGSDMKGLVERYSQILKSIETITKDIQRLERRG